MTDETTTNPAAAESVHDILSKVRVDLQTLVDICERGEKSLLDQSVLRLSLLQSALELLAAFKIGAPIVPVPAVLARTVDVSNKVVSFLLDEEIHFGTGVLVGPAHVLTAAHLFFERESGRLIDRERLRRISVEVHTTLIDEIIMEGPRNEARLYRPETNEWLIDPWLDGDFSDRDVTGLDFAIVRLDKRLGDDPVGACNRGWVDIPTAESATVLSNDLPLQVFEFLDRDALLTSIGFARGIIENGTRLLHTASTARSASGAPILDAESRLIALHVGGPVSGEVPSSRRALPIRRVAEIVDQPLPAGGSIRSLLK